MSRATAGAGGGIESLLNEGPIRKAALKTLKSKEIKTYSGACVHPSLEAHGARFGMTVLFEGEKLLYQDGPESDSNLEKRG